MLEIPDITFDITPEKITKRQKDAENRRQIFNKLADLEGDELKVISILVDKMLLGSNKYGSWDSENDKRDYQKEAMEEVMDALNYCAMKMVKEISK